jgi:hypothetical protein
LQVMNKDLAGLSLISGLHEVQASLIWGDCRMYLNGSYGDPVITGDRDCIYRGEPTTLARLGPEPGVAFALAERLTPGRAIPEVAAETLCDVPSEHGSDVLVALGHAAVGPAHELHRGALGDA